jgi:hypothetical protein
MEAVIVDFVILAMIIFALNGNPSEEKNKR